MVWFGKKNPKDLATVSGTTLSAPGNEEAHFDDLKNEGSVAELSFPPRTPILHVEPVPVGQTIIGPDAEFKGSITSKGVCRVVGRMEGDVTAIEVILDIGSSMGGNIQANTAQVQGSLTGNITADSVSLLADAHVTGDILYGSISMERGAHVVGNLKPQNR
jgi:cytoskeletal protein CcmA (bactofilin family)